MGCYSILIVSFHSSQAPLRYHAPQKKGSNNDRESWLWTHLPIVNAPFWAVPPGAHLTSQQLVFVWDNHPYFIPVQIRAACFPTAFYRSSGMLMNIVPCGDAVLWPGEDPKSKDPKHVVELNGRLFCGRVKEPPNMSWAQPKVKMTSDMTPYWIVSEPKTADFTNELIKSERAVRTYKTDPIRPANFESVREGYVLVRHQNHNEHAFGMGVVKAFTDAQKKAHKKIVYDVLKGQAAPSFITYEGQQYRLRHGTYPRDMIEYCAAAHVRIPQVAVDFHDEFMRRNGRETRFWSDNQHFGDEMKGLDAPIMFKSAQKFFYDENGAIKGLRPSGNNSSCCPIAPQTGPIPSAKQVEFQTPRFSSPFDKLLVFEDGSLKNPIANTVLAHVLATKNIRSRQIVRSQQWEELRFDRLRMEFSANSYDLSKKGPFKHPKQNEHILPEKCQM